jgi:glycerate dehydrogenase
MIKNLLLTTPIESIDSRPFLHLNYLELYMINQETLALMKPTAFVINTSRGALIDEKALIGLRQSNKTSSLVRD